MRSLAVLLMLALPPSVAAQSTFKLKPPVDQLQWMIGEWEGPASYQRGPQTTPIRQTERVEIQSGGTAIAVQGRGYFRSPDGTEEVRYEAFAVLFKNRDGSLGFRAFNMEGQYIDPTITLNGDVLIWSFDDPRIGKVRYTTTHTPADEWHEIGEWSRDGTTWTQFMEMTLKRRQRGSGAAGQMNRLSSRAERGIFSDPAISSHGSEWQPVSVQPPYRLTALPPNDETPPSAAPRPAGSHRRRAACPP